MFRLRVPWRVKNFIFRRKVRLIRWFTYQGLSAILKTPPIYSDDESEIEVHSLVDHGYLIYYLVAIKSLYSFSKRKFSIYCHCCNRNMTKRDVEILKKHVVGVHYIERDFADSEMKQKLASYKLCYKYRIEHEEIIGTSAKLFDQLLISRKNRVILLDADTLFFQIPSEILAWIGSGSQESLYIKDKVNWYCIPYPEINSIQDLPKVPAFFNAGLLCFDKRFLVDNFSRIEDTLQLIEKNGGEFSALDQTIYAMLLPNKRLLPEAYSCEVRKTVATNRHFVFKHYIGHDVRFGNLIYLQEGKAIINKLKAQKKYSQPCYQKP